MNVIEPKLNENFIFETKKNSAVILIIVKVFWAVIYQILAVISSEDAPNNVDSYKHRISQKKKREKSIIFNFIKLSKGLLSVPTNKCFLSWKFWKL